MKKILLLSLLCLNTIIAWAQEGVPTVRPTNKQELGIFGQTDGSSDDKSLSMVGLQYKRWHNEHLGFRVIAAFGDYYSSGPELRYVSGDTSITKRQHFDVNLPIVGIGMEAQRHFFKRIYLFAAMELRGGYGSGIADTSVNFASGQGSSAMQIGQNIGRMDASLIYAGFNASIGAKAQWDRICVGLEVSPIQMSYTNTNDSKRSVSNTDLSIGSFSHRLFIHWRF